MLGFTGVIWPPRGATRMSVDLYTGTGPGSLMVAGAAWGSIAAAYGEASVTLGATIAELRVAWEGIAADMALAKIIPFTAWTAETSTLAAVTSVKAEIEAGVFSVAAVAMPSPAEIAVVQTVKAVALTVGGPLAGAAAVAEAYDRSMDIRASLAMEAYEAASAVVATPVHFNTPPEITNSGTHQASDLAMDAVAAPKAASDLLTQAASAMGAPGSPVNVAAHQLGQAAGSGVWTASSVASNAVSGVATSSVPTASTGAGMGPMLPPGGLGGGSSLTTSATARGGAPRPSGPVGSKGAGSPSLTPRFDSVVPGGPNASSSVSSGSGVAGDLTAAHRGGAGAPMMPPRTGLAQDDEERQAPTYRNDFEHFADGRVVSPPVIGADPVMTTANQQP